MNHVARVHHKAGQGLEASGADYELYKWLWKKRIISDEVHKDLKGDFEARKGEVLSTVSEGMMVEARREGVGARRLG